MPAKVPDKNVTIVAISEMNSLSFGDCSKGCETNSKPKQNDTTTMANTTASSTPTVTTMRACRSLGVYLCRVMVLCRIGQARCSYLTSCFLLVI